MDAAIFIVLTLLPLFIELARQARFIKLDGLLVINLSFAITYGYAGLVHFYLSDPLYRHYSEEERYITGVLCLISYATVTISYWSTFRWLRFESCSESCLISDSDRIFGAGVVAFVVGVISVLIYSSMYGGISNALRYAATIRSGYGEDLLVGTGSFLFFKNLIPLLQFFPFLMLGRLLAVPALSRLLLFFGSSAVAVFGLMLMSGRGRVVLFVALLLICVWLYRSNSLRMHPTAAILLVPVVLSVDFFITYGKEIFRLFDAPEVSFAGFFDGKSYVPFSEFTSYYAHRVESILTAIEDTRFSPTYFYDAFSIPLFVMPSRLTGVVAPDSISYINTFLQTGVWDSMTPPGLVAYGYYSMGVFGVVASSLFLGFVVAALDKKNCVEGLKGNSAVFYRLPFIIIFCVYYFQGDPRVLAVNLAATILFYLLTRLARLRIKYIP